MITKAIANNLKNVLDTILSPSQTANVPGRTIFSNLFQLRDTIYFCQERNLNAYILSIDQEKAFDKLNRKFLYKILQKMNFGQKFINSIKAIYENTKGILMINGYASIAFDLSRGVRQGCPLSMPLYSLYIEPLAIQIRKEPGIKGIPTIGGNAHVTLQYADDITLLLSQNTNLHKLFELLTRFTNATGSTINQSKTKGLCIGRLKIDEDHNLRQILWQNLEGLEILGIHFFTDSKHTQNHNWKIAINTLKEQTLQLKKRKLSLKGKTLVLNTVVMAKIWYLATVLPIPEVETKTIQAVLFDYLWGGKNNNPITRNVVYQPKHKGGLYLKNPILQQKALQIKFAEIIGNPNEKAPWVVLPRYWIGFHMAPLKPEWAFLRGNSLPKSNTPLYSQTTKRKIERPKYYNNMIHQLKAMDMSKIIWTTAYFYSEFIKDKYELPRACIDKWNQAGCNPDNLWELVYATYALGKHQDIHFKFLHRIHKSNVFVKQRTPSMNWNQLNLKCAVCPDNIEDNEHIFFNCPAADLVWNFIYPTVQEILKPNPFKIPSLILNDFPQGTSIQKKKMVLTLIQISMHSIWMNRNKVLFDKANPQELLPLSENVIHYSFLKILKQKFREYLPNRMAKFRQDFCHTPLVCTVFHNNDLLVNLL